MTRRMFKRILILSAFAGVLGFQGLACPIDGSNAIWTGNTKIDSATAKLLKEYKCLHGHVFWVVA